MNRGVHFRQPLTPAWRQRGFSKFELALVAALFAVFVGMAADRLHAYQKNADLVAAKQLIVSLQAALTLRTAQLTITQRRADIAALADENPIGWLHERPPNYLGEYYSPDNQRLPPGHWYFNRRNKTLVYLSIDRKIFASSKLRFLKFKVKSLRQVDIPDLTTAPATIDKLVLIQVFDDPVVNKK